MPRSRPSARSADRFPRPPSAWGDGRAGCVGLLGGSFNPAHDGHRHISQCALRLLGLDQVWWLVSPQNPLKPRAGMAPLADRLASCRRAQAGDRRILPVSLESGLRSAYTADTLATLRRRFPNLRFVWLMGADNLVQLPRWHRWRDIVDRTPIAVFARAPYSKGALAGHAARRYARHRLAPHRAHTLVSSAPPVWVFLPIRKHAASATALRARGWGAAWRAQTDGEDNS